MSTRKGGYWHGVMKPFAGGTLLDAATSPFNQALTKYQCIQYCLDKPGVKTVIPGTLIKNILRKCWASLMLLRKKELIIGSFYAD